MESNDSGTLLFSWRGCLFRVPDQVQAPKAGSLFFCRHLVVRPGERMLEIGGGLGLAAVLAAKSGARVTATDVLPEAVEVMRANAALNGVTVDARLGDCYAPVNGERFDLICTNALQMPTRTGQNPVWPVASGRSMLSNPLYTGEGHSTSTKSGVPRTETRRKFHPRTDNYAREPRPPEEWVPITAPALISAETFAQAQEQLKQNQGKARRAYQPTSQR